MNVVPFKEPEQKSTRAVPEIRFEVFPTRGASSWALRLLARLHILPPWMALHRPSGIRVVDRTAQGAVDRILAMRWRLYRLQRIAAAKAAKVPRKINASVAHASTEDWK